MKIFESDLEINLEKLIDSRMLIYANSGAGKTYLASMIAEQMLDVKAQIIVIDPIGNWWGLRVNADEKSKGKERFDDEKFMIEKVRKNKSGVLKR